MIVQDVIFWILSAMAVIAALGVVLVQDLFRAALLLIVVFMAVAGFFVLLSAEFLAVVQILIYVGAIAILIIFSASDDPYSASCAIKAAGKAATTNRQEQARRAKCRR